MTQQARPDWNAEMDRQTKATESAQALANHWQAVADRQRHEILKLRVALVSIANMPIGECETVHAGNESCDSCCKIDAIARLALEKDT